MNVTLRQLRAFTCVARLTSFAAAAAEMSVTPSALSVLIRELESATKLRLFDRSTRSVALSAAGREFLPYAQQVLIDLENARRCVVDLQQQRRGTIRIAATQMMFLAALPPLLLKFREAYPGIGILPVDVPVDGVLDALEAGRADVAMFAERRSRLDLHVDHLFDTSMHLVCHPNSPLARRRKVKWAEICDEPLVFIGADTKARLQTALGWHYDFPQAYEIAVGTTALAMVTAGMGSAVILGVVKPVAASMGHAIVPLVDPVVTRRIMLYTSARRADPMTVGLFSEFAKDYFRSSGSAKASRSR
ncbi:LysR family transcriptional regulator [Hydrogenophaga sp.]|uniref:LysR family transcriptional regulator n=1 Tax=Hydrogenophaga sp. TaxID=1904254 RepID=UPI00271F4793|nr:LysR family transcriptional regulator [Hydrogenophaga sp.]MDO9433831.1 LysR family transcriptional regulator [Hydrogenophaga sp.]